MIIAMAVMCIWIPDLVGPGPSWTYFLYVIIKYINSLFQDLFLDLLLVFGFIPQWTI